MKTSGLARTCADLPGGPFIRHAPPRLSLERQRACSYCRAELEPSRLTCARCGAPT